MAIELHKPTSKRHLAVQERKDSMNSSSTATISSADSPPAANDCETARAEELANRLIAFSQMAQIGAERREATANANDGKASTVPSVSVNTGSMPPLPIRRPSVGAAAGNLRKNPPPPPPPRRNCNDTDLPVGRKYSFDVSKLEEDQQRDSSKSSSFHEHQRPIKSEFDQSSLKDMNNMMHTYSQSSRDFNESPTDLEPRKVRVTQFNDEPEEQIESSESLPSHCDKKGRCIYHSNIKLYKRHLLGGFSLVLKECPLCEAASLEVPKGRPTIVIKRSISAGRESGGNREKSLERGVSRSTSLERRSSANPKLTRKALSATESGSRVQGVSAFLEDTNHVDRASERKTSSLVLSPTARSKAKLSRKAMSETGASRSQGGTSFLEDRQIDMAVSPNIARPMLQSKKAISENGVDTRSHGGTAFLEEHRPCRPSHPEYPSSGSADRRTSSTRGSPIPVKPKLLRKAMSETDQDIRYQGDTAFLDMNQKADMPAQHGKSGSGSSHTSSPLSTPDTQSSRPKLISNTLEDAPSSMLEKGLEKLSILSRKGLTSSRARSSDNSTIKSLGSRARSENTDLASPSTRSKSAHKSKRRAWDNSGRCKKHPAIILARKRPFGNGWDKIRDCCPMCAEAHSEVSTSLMNHLLGQDRSPAPNEFNTSYHSADQEPRRSRSRGRLDGSKRAVTCRFNNERNERSSYETPSAQVNRVHKMPYSAPWGEKGSYTGEVNDNGKPHGQGKMRTKTGNVVDGTWINGCHEDYIDKHKKMKSGFGTNIAPWKQNAASPHFEPNAGCRLSSKAQPSNKYPMGMMPQAMAQTPPLQQQPYGGQMQQYDYSQQYDQHWQQQTYPQQQHNYHPQQHNYSQQQQQQQYWQPQHNPDPSMMYGQMSSHQYHS